MVLLTQPFSPNGALITDSPDRDRPARPDCTDYLRGRAFDGFQWHDNRHAAVSRVERVTGHAQMAVRIPPDGLDLLGFEAGRLHDAPGRIGPVRRQGPVGIAGGSGVWTGVGVAFNHDGPIQVA